MTKQIFYSLTLGFLALPTLADVYWQFPPGSNNRLNENTNNRNNDNRLFDSQNNDRAGFNINKYEFYVGTELELAWTLQHSCGENAKAECQTILQYMCNGDPVALTDETVNLQEGRTTNTPSSNDADNPQTGQHEPPLYYKHCVGRQRNKGLYTADQLDPKSQNGKHTARFTRQDNQGTRYGLECPEERDYYPYWGPTPWKDIAVLVDNPGAILNEPVDTTTTVKTFYQNESENVKGRQFCKTDKNSLRNLPDNYNPARDSDLKLGNQITKDCGGINSYSSSHEIPAPKIVKNLESKDNHHGNAVNGRFFDSYKWLIPENLAGKDCVIRLRYNMSSPELNNWNLNQTDIIQEGNQNQDRFNQKNLNPKDKTGPKEIYQKFGLSDQEAYRRNYRQVNDAKIYPHGQVPLRIEMSYNTDQLARTFEDRTYIIKFLARQGNTGNEVQNIPSTATIHNLYAEGKPGTDVEAYPNFQFDFYPQTIVAKKGDFIHFQFSGDSRNDKNNNVAITDELGGLIKRPSENEDLPDVQEKHRLNWVPIRKSNDNIPERDLENSDFLGISLNPAEALEFNSEKDARKFMAKLATQGVYGDGKTYASNQPGENYVNTGKELKPYRVDHGLVRLTETGEWHYMSTHNSAVAGNVMKGKIRVVEN